MSFSNRGTNYYNQKPKEFLMSILKEEMRNQKNYMLNCNNIYKWRWDI